MQQEEPDAARILIKRNIHITESKKVRGEIKQRKRTNFYQIVM